MISVICCLLGVLTEIDWNGIEIGKKTFFFENRWPYLL